MTDRASHEAPADSDGSATTRYFHVRGKVQNVMFRQTVIRAMAKRELTGGATNDSSDKKLVHITLRGSDKGIDELMDTIGSGKQLNDWGAAATSVTEIDKAHGKSLSAHQVTTANVDTKRWNPNCTMFI